jgi:hypothetical protein
VGISGATVAFDDDGVTLESDVTFMRGEKEGELGGVGFDGMAEDDFPVIPISLFVWEDKLTQAEEGVEARE